MILQIILPGADDMPRLSGPSVVTLESKKPNVEFHVSDAIISAIDHNRLKHVVIVTPMKKFKGNFKLNLPRNVTFSLMEAIDNGKSDTTLKLLYIRSNSEILLYDCLHNHLPGSYNVTFNGIAGSSRSLATVFKNRNVQLINPMPKVITNGNYGLLSNKHENYHQQMDDTANLILTTDISIPSIQINRKDLAVLHHNH